VREPGLVTGVRRSVWDPEPSRERVGDWGGPETVWALLCVAERRATRPNGEWGYSTRRQCWAMSAQRRCHPQEALYLPTFSHLLIVNKLFSLSLSLSLYIYIYMYIYKLLSLSLSLSLSLPARPLYQGGCASVWDPEPSKERVGDWGGPATVLSPLCVAETRATRPNGEWGYNTRRQCWAKCAQRRCHAEEALYLPTFIHLFYCQ